jgi:hypothetical protein
VFDQYGTWWGWAAFAASLRTGLGMAATTNAHRRKTASSRSRPTRRVPRWWTRPLLTKAGSAHRSDSAQVGAHPLYRRDHLGVIGVVAPVSDERYNIPKG